MSKLFAVLMAKADEAIDNYIYITKLSLEIRMASIAGGVQPGGAQKEVEKLLSSMDQKITALIKLLPLVENNPKYQPVSKRQLRIDTKFDRFLKSKFPESYFRKRQIDLAALAEEWNEVTYMEDRLLYLLTVTMPRRIKRLSARSKTERKIANGQNQIANFQERVKKLKGSIKNILEADPKTISGDSKVITPEIASRWQKHWETKLADLVKRYSDWSQEDFAEALEWMLKSIETSKEMVVKRIFPAEVELRQIDYWLTRIFDPKLANRDNFGASVQKVKEEVERNISVIFKILPALWVNGELEIQELENGESFLKGKYPPIIINWVDSALSGVNWDFLPGYNDNVQTPFLNQKLLEPTTHI